MSLPGDSDAFKYQTLPDTRYLMRIVFLSDVIVLCSSESNISEPLDCLACFEVAVGAELSESEIARAHMLTLAERCAPPRFWAMLLKRLSSTSISFLTSKKKQRSLNKS